MGAIVRQFIISDYSGHIRENAFYEILSLKFFPDDAVSRRQFYGLVLDEIARTENTAPDYYEPSEVLRVGAASLRKRFGQMHTAGLVALVMCCRDSSGHRMSLNSAAPIVSEYAATFPDVVIPPFSKVTKELRIGISTDVSTIESTFRKWRRVAALLAADITTQLYFQPAMFPRRNVSYEYSYMKTLAYFQARLKNAERYESWDAWQIDGSPPDFFDAVPICYPSTALIDNLFRPWELSLVPPDPSDL